MDAEGLDGEEMRGNMTWHRISYFAHAISDGSVTLPRGDFAYTELRLDDLESTMKKEYKGKEPIMTFAVYSGPFIDPMEVGAYAFRSWTNIQSIESMELLDFGDAVDTILTFNGVDETGLFEFKVHGKHQGDSYKGNSGTPIFDQKPFIATHSPALSPWPG